MLSALLLMSNGQAFHEYLKETGFILAFRIFTGDATMISEHQLKSRDDKNFKLQLCKFGYFPGYIYWDLTLTVLRTNILKVKIWQGQILSLLSCPRGLALLFLSFLKWGRFHHLTVFSLKQTLQTASRHKVSSSLTVSF